MPKMFFRLRRLLAVLLLGEPFTWRIAGGAALIVAGLLVLAGGK